MNSFKDKMIFHTHVEKAAGTTLVNGLKEALGTEHVHDLRPPAAKSPSDMASAEKVRLYVLTGHFHYGAYMNDFARPKTFIATIRHPFDRFRSYVNYVRSGHPAYRYVGGKTFAEVIGDYIDARRPQADNQMARVLTGLKSPTFEQARDNIEQNYLFVAPHQRVNDALSSLLGVVNHTAPPPRLHSNKGPKKPMEDVGDLEARFNRANELDIELHRYCEDRFGHWMETLQERWASISASKPEGGGQRAQSGRKKAPIGVLKTE